MAFTSLNGYLNGRWLFKLSAGFSASWLTDLRFIFGAALFVAGLIINLHSDSLLRSLRAPGESGYKVPQGGFFRYVSCANYFGVDRRMVRLGPGHLVAGRAGLRRMDRGQLGPPRPQPPPLVPPHLPRLSAQTQSAHSFPDLGLAHFFC